MKFKIKNIARAKCTRCGVENEVEMITENGTIPLISKVILEPLDYVGRPIEELQGEEYYICDDCWNETLDFFRINRS